MTASPRDPSREPDPRVIAALAAKVAAASLPAGHVPAGPREPAYVETDWIRAIGQRRL